MSNKRSTIIVAQESARQSPDFKEALASIAIDARVEIVQCSSLAETLVLCDKTLPASVWLDPELPGFSVEVLSAYIAKASQKPLSATDWFLFGANDSILGQDSVLINSIQPIDLNSIGRHELKRNLNKGLGIIKVTEVATAFTYSWSGKAAIGEKEAHDRIFGEERFRRLVHNSLDLICVIEEDGFIKYVSESSERILGHPATVLSGQTIQAVFPHFNVRRMQEFFRKAANRGSISTLQAQSASGAPVSLELVCSDMRTDPVIRGYVINARDVTSKRVAEEKLKFQARLLSNIREAVIGIDPQQRILYLNQAAERLYKTTHSQAKGRLLDSLFSWEFSGPEEQSHFSDFLRENGLWLGEAVQVTSSGRRIHAEISITNHSNQELPCSIIVVRDIKDRKVVENVLHESESRFKNLVDLTSDLVWQIDSQANLTFISPKVAELLGYTQSELIGKPFEILFWHSENVPVDTSYESFLEVLNSRAPFTHLSFSFTDKHGNEKIFELSGLPILKNGMVFQGFQGVVRDITQRVASEKALRSSLAEKEILIKEIHHRVKNNMQIVSSLLFLQSQFIKDPDMLSKLQESQDRIKSMALVHEKLYQSTDLNRIDFRDYIESLTRHISNSYRNVSVDLRIEIEDNNLLMPIDSAIPCGLILNELVSNGYKHAFKPGQRGELTVAFTSQEGKATLTVADNGVGIGSLDISSYENTSLGMQLVLALTKQLRGKIKVSNQGGSTFQIIFPL